MKYFTTSIRITWFFLLPTICFYNTIGQATGDAKEDFLYGEYYLAQGMYAEAIPFYISSLKEKPDNSNINYRIGFCYSKMIGEQHKALLYLKEAVKEVEKNYYEGNYKNTASPIESWMLLGDAYHRINELTNASYSYNEYLKLIGNSDEQRKLLVKRKIEGLGVSYEFQRTENPVVLINFGEVINSRFSDYNPVISGDQKTMIYTQFWETLDKIMITYKTGNTWSVPVEINEQIGSLGDCYTSALSFKGDELFLIKYSNDNYDIYSTKLIDGRWTIMAPLGGKINTKHQESSICISADGNYIYFGSNRPGGEGGFDIYIAEKIGNSWGNIKNLGKVINTKRNEEGPCISYDGTVLYFSSNGHETIGNMDILYSEIDNEGNWQLPVNIGYPINTTSDDLFYIYFKNTKTGYLSRDLTEGLGKNDIYAIVEEAGVNISLGAFQIKNIIESRLNTNDDHIDILHSTGDSSTIPAGIKPLEEISKNDVKTNSVDLKSENYIPVAGTTNTPVAPIVASPGLSVNIESSTLQDQPVETLNNSSINENDEKINEPDTVIEVVIRPTISETSTEKPETINLSASSPETTDTSSVKGIVKPVSELDIAIADISAGNNIIESPQQETFTQEPSDITLISDSIPTYTIQLFALKKPIKVSEINIIPIVVSKGGDGLIRYTTGEYRGWSVALSHLNHLRANGFPDAFIRNIDSISNYLILEK